MDVRQVVLDTETTGLEPSQGHRIIEIGCVELVNRRLTHNRFHQYLQPDREIDAGAVEVHGITNDKLADQPRFADVVEEFLAVVYLAMPGGQASLLLDAGREAAAAAAADIRRLSAARAPLRIVHATAAEQEEHARYLQFNAKKSGGISLWAKLDAAVPSAVADVVWSTTCES